MSTARKALIEDLMLRDFRQRVEGARQQLLDISTGRGAAILGPELAGLHSTLFVLRNDMDAIALDRAEKAEAELAALRAGDNT